MPQHKVTWFFAAQLGSLNPGATLGALGGWTETFYDPRDITDSIALSSAFGSMQTRLELLTRGWRCYLIRVSRFPLTRTAAKLAVQPVDGGGVYPSPSGVITDEQAYDVLIVNFASISGRQRSWGLRGIGPDVVGANGLYLAPANFVSRFQLFQNLWAGANPYALRITTNQTLQLISGVISAPVIGFPTATQASPVVQTSGAILAGPPFPRVRITGVQGMSGLNGTWQVQNSFAAAGITSHQLAPKRNRLVTGTYLAGGTLVPFTISLENLNVAAPGQGGPHKVGRVPFAPRGRRSRRQL